MREVQPCLSVVVPCYNESATVKALLDRVLARPEVAEIIVVDDGSTDDTFAIVTSIGDTRIRCFRQPCNLGKGAALRRGFREATQDYVIVQDADLEYDPADYAKLLEPLLDGRADVVYGSRFAGGSAHRVLYYWHSVGNRFLTVLSNMFTNLNLTDMETCYKVFRREVIQGFDIEEDRFGFEPEITAKIAAAKWRVYEVGISYDGRTYAEGKKIGWRDGVRAIYGIVRYSSARGSSGTPLPSKFADADQELALVLEDLTEATNYVEWIYEQLEPFLGDRVLEIGAGHGTFTRRIAQSGREVVATDASKRAIEVLRNNLMGIDNATAVFAEGAEFESLGRFDSALLVNVLEHIEDDESALRNLREHVLPGGHLLVFSPAHPNLYSKFDRSVGHVRRYRRSQLIETADRAGWEIVSATPMNALGAVAWWVFAKQMRQTPTKQWSAKLFDRYGVPLSRTIEHRRTPRFGQSLLLIARNPVE
jgi:SAM-dependent methyltransferase